MPAGIEQAWTAFNHLDRLEPCLPGVTLIGRAGDVYEGSVKIKFGPIALVYDGSTRYVERNAAARRTVIQTRGRDKRGNGTAVTTITATFADQGDRTEVALHTDLDLSGKPARFGREVVTDVVDRVVEQFSSTLAGKFAEGEVAAPAAPPDLRRRSLADEAEPLADQPIGVAAEADVLDAEVPEAPETDISEFPPTPSPLSSWARSPGSTRSRPMDGPRSRRSWTSRLPRSSSRPGRQPRPPRGRRLRAATFPRETWPSPTCRRRARWRRCWSCS